VRLALQDGADNLGDGRAHSCGPMNQPRGCPFQVRLVALRPDGRRCGIAQ
jgi:hypothetical protein